MRFDGCDDFYYAFLNDFCRLGISYDIVSSIYDMNYNNLILTRKEENDKEENKLFYQNSSITDRFNKGDNSEVVHYVAKKDKDGNIVIRPLNLCFNDNICNFRGKKTVFEDGVVKTLSTAKDGIMLETFCVDPKSLSIQIYDEEALKYLKNYNIKYSDKDPAGKIYKETRIRPDITILVDKKENIIETCDDRYEKRLDNIDFLTYKNCKIEARKLIKIINERKL